MLYSWKLLPWGGRLALGLHQGELVGALFRLIFTAEVFKIAYFAFIGLHPLLSWVWWRYLPVKIHTSLEGSDFLFNHKWELKLVFPWTCQHIKECYFFPLQTCVCMYAAIFLLEKHLKNPLKSVPWSQTAKRELTNHNQTPQPFTDRECISGVMWNDIYFVLP